MKNKKKLLMIEPHSDDGFIGAGGFLEKYRNSYEYHFALITASDMGLHHNKFLTREERLSEFANYVEYFNGTWHRVSVNGEELPLDQDSKLDVYSRTKLVAFIERVILKVMPDVLLVTGSSFHHDHTAVYEATIAATRPTSNFIPDEIYILENPTYIHAPYDSNKFSPDTYVCLTEKDIVRKLDAFQKLFPSQVREKGNCLSREGLYSWARYRGLETRCEYAETLQTFSRKM